jgi:hypothetical protein
MEYQPSASIFEFILLLHSNAPRFGAFDEIDGPQLRVIFLTMDERLGATRYWRYLSAVNVRSIEFPDQGRASLISAILGDEGHHS